MKTNGHQAGRASASRYLCLLVLCLAAAARDLPEFKLLELQDSLAEAQVIESSVAQRRAFKSVVREAESLLRRYRDSPERFRLYGVIFESQKMLFSTEADAEHQEALFETARHLLEAPDEYAELRVEPDILLLQFELANARSKPGDSARAIAEFADRYRGTPAEAKSLMIAATITFDLGNDILLEAFRKALAKRFAHQAEVSAFMRERFAAKADVSLRGTFERADGGEMSFPIGRPYVVCFWSQDTPLLAEKIADIKALQERLKDALTVYSFNLDELADGGQRALQRLNLNWVPLRLPGGTENAVYRSSGGSNLFAALLVDAHGQAAIDVAGGRGHGAAPSVPVSSRLEAATRFPRQSALLRALCIGDYLLADSAGFTPPPMRYRMTADEELQQYQSIEQTAKAREPRILAMLAQWRLTGDSAHLSRALESAKALSSTGSVVANLAIASQALQEEGAQAGTVIDAFIEATGGEEAPGVAHAAALMLSLEAHSVDQYLKHRGALLGKHARDQASWPVSSFLLDDATAARLFGHALPGKGENLAPAVVADRRFVANWSAIAGSPVALPAADGRVRLLLFVEENSDAKAMEIPRRFVDQLAKSVADRAIQNVEIIAVFRSDAEKAGALMKRHKWAFKAVALADTDWVPLARQYGLFATDRMPNAFVLGPEGDIMLALTGASPVAERHDQYVYQVENAIREYDLALAEQALAAGDYAAYAERLAVTFPLEGRQRDRYEPDSRAEILHRRQLIWAYVQLKDWQRALDAANASIAAHEKQERCRTCERRVMQLGERATLLKILGRDADAEKANALFMASICPAMLNAEGVAEKAVSEVERRLPKFGGSHERFLQDAEIRMAQEGQELHVFGLQHDLAMRAQALAGLGQVEAAATDRLRAAAFAWPHVVTEFHPYLLHEGFESRRKQARRALTKGEWQTALDLANANIDNHEAEAIRYDSRCEICGPQVRSFQLMADVLKDQLNKPDDAEAALAMAEEAICPKAEVSNTFMFFPMNRLYGGSGPGKSRYNFILGHMKGDGSCYPNQTHRKHRLEFAGDLFLRAQALEQLGRADEAQRDRKRASALTYPHGSAAAGGADELPARYVDVLSVKAE